MTPKELTITSVDDLRSTIKCMESSGHTGADQVALLEAALTHKPSVTKRKLLESAIKRWKGKEEPKSAPQVAALEFVSLADWQALSKEDQFKRFEQAQFDAIGWERNYRGAKDEMAREVGALKAKIAMLEKEAEADSRRTEQQSREIWELSNDKKVLKRQLEEAQIVPLR